MAIEQNVNIATVITKVKDRTWRLECFTDYGTDYRLVAHRERIYLDADNKVVKTENLPGVVRTVSAVASEPDAMLMLGLIRDTIDAWAIEDASKSSE